MSLLPLQTEIRPVIKAVHGNVDYQRFREQLERINELLHYSGVEAEFVRRSVIRYEAEAAAVGSKLKRGNIVRHQKMSIVGLRCVLLKTLLGVSCRDMTIGLAGCDLYQWFCGIETFGVDSQARVEVTYDRAEGIHYGSKPFVYPDGALSASSRC